MCKIWSLEIALVSLHNDSSLSLLLPHRPLPLLCSLSLSFLPCPFSFLSLLSLLYPASIISSPSLLSYSLLLFPYPLNLQPYLTPPTLSRTLLPYLLLLPYTFPIFLITSSSLTPFLLSLLSTPYPLPSFLTYSSYLTPSPPSLSPLPPPPSPSLPFPSPYILNLSSLPPFPLPKPPICNSLKPAITYLTCQTRCITWIIWSCVLIKYIKERETSLLV